MNKYKRQLISALLAGVLVLSGCGKSKEEPTDLEKIGSDVGMEDPVVTTWTQPPLPAPFEKVDQSNADKVAEAVVTEMFSWKPGQDVSPADAAERASALMTDQCIARNSNSWSAMAGLPGPLWRSWVESKAGTQVSLTPSLDVRPPDKDAQAYRQYGVTVKVNSKETTTVIYNVLLVLDKLGWWQVSDIKIDSPIITSKPAS